MAAETARGFAVFAGIAPEIIRASAREAEARGFASFWVNHPGPVDGMGALAQAGAETQRIDLGVGVIPLHTRGPEDIVAGVRQHRLAPTRLLLGIGSPNPQALRRVREGVAAIRKGLQTRIIVAALGPKMCHLAGEVADGVLFNWLTHEYARRSSELVRAGTPLDPRRRRGGGPPRRRRSRPPARRDGADQGRPAVAAGSAWAWGWA